MAGYLGAVPVPQATQHRDTFTATDGQTTFNVQPYTPTFLDVYLNGVRLNAADVTATNGTSVVLVACETDDIVDVISYTAFEVGSLSANSVDSDQYVDGSIDTVHIADANVTTAKIADVNVTQGKLADQAVNEAKLQVSNAPTNGYFLSAQSGNTGGMTWAEAGGDPTGESSVATLPTNAGSITFGSIPDGIKWARLIVYNANIDTASKRYLVRLGSSAEVHASDGDYSSRSQEVANTTAITETSGMIVQYNVSVNTSNANHLIFNLYKQEGTNIWITNHFMYLRNNNKTVIGVGVCTVLDSRLTQIVFKTTGGNFSSGTANIQWGY